MQSADEPLPGTAAHQRRWVLLELPGAWGHDVLDGEALGAELTPKLAAHLRAAKARLLFIRRPGRPGQQRTYSRVYLVDTAPGVRRMLTLQVDAPEELLDIDLHTGGRGAAAGAPPGTLPASAEVSEVVGPVVLVCTHGKRDKCCAVRGRPVAARLEHELGAELAAVDPHAHVWECSHTSGHRFAPVMVVMDGGLTYGSSLVEDYIAAIRAALAGRVSLDGYRGRSAFLPVEQVAEIAVRRLLAAPNGDAADGSLTAIDALVATSDANDIDPLRATVAVHHSDGRSWSVQLRWRDLPSRPASCGGPAKPAGTWDVVAVDPASESTTAETTGE